VNSRYLLAKSLYSDPNYCDCDDWAQSEHSQAGIASHQKLLVLATCHTRITLLSKQPRQREVDRQKQQQYVCTINQYSLIDLKINLKNSIKILKKVLCNNY